MEEEKVDGRWSKKEKRHKEVGGGGCKISAPTHLNSSKVESTLKKKNKTKKIFFKVSSIFQNPNFQIKNFHSQAFNFTFSMPKFQTQIFSFQKFKL